MLRFDRDRDIDCNYIAMHMSKLKNQLTFVYFIFVQIKRRVNHRQSLSSIFLFPHTEPDSILNHYIENCSEIRLDKEMNLNSKKYKKNKFDKCYKSMEDDDGDVIPEQLVNISPCYETNPCEQNEHLFSSITLSMEPTMNHGEQYYFMWFVKTKGGLTKGRKQQR
jgi:hypothetical protein